MSSKEIIEAVKNKFGLELTYQQVGFYDYDPSDDESKLGKQWQELFLKERKKAENDESNVPVSHRAFRIKLLYKMIEKAMNSGNMVLAADLLKQVAEEMGGKYTNQQKVDTTSNGNTTGNTVVNNFTDPMAASQFYQELMGAK